MPSNLTSSSFLQTSSRLELTSAGWKVGLPFLRYESTDSYALTKGYTKIAVSPRFDPTVNTDTAVSILPLYLVMYHLNGTYAGFKKLEGELLLCPHRSVDNSRSHMFGVDYTLECILDPTYFLSLQQETMIYELYLKDGSNYVDIPVVIESDDSNKKYKEEDLKNANGLQFYRRFYLIDRATGIPSPSDIDNLDAPECRELQTSKPTVVRFASTIKFYLDSQESTIDRFSRPYLYLKYSSTKSTGSSVAMSYRSIYYMNMPTFYSAFLGILITILIIAAIVAAVRIWIWTKLYPIGATTGQNPVIERRGSKLVNTSIFVIMETFGLALFFFLCVLSFYVYAFYKWQRGVFMLLPSEDEYVSDYMPFYVLLSICIVLILISNVIAIFRQSFSDIFFIDWVDLGSLGKTEIRSSKIGQSIYSRPKCMANSPGWKRV